MFFWPVVWVFFRECILWFCVLAMLWCFLEARPLGRARFRCIVGRLGLICGFLMCLLGVVMGLDLDFVCWYGILVCG